MASGCGCKEVYRFPHITYPYSSCICSFLQQYINILYMFYLHLYINILFIYKYIICFIYIHI